LQIPLYNSKMSLQITSRRKMIVADYFCNICKVTLVHSCRQCSSTNGTITVVTHDNKKYKFSGNMTVEERYDGQLYDKYSGEVLVPGNYHNGSRNFKSWISIVLDIFLYLFVFVMLLFMFTEWNTVPL